ncbi:8498_t:CDS:1 [Funneliformis geosporum]|uniref:8474_t:CDS:1 n=1 Tax=Funneliformis geosporum TaxID=1117311 RepID=A0A9W4SDJ3_9GLOM|nr:8474_t:CDS:1 [Funneliformis geosporum]CAI2166653.1 8498_t:CDS:1 [Funneliformis geosporum]
MNTYAFVAAFLSNIMEIPIITYDEYLSQKSSNPDQLYKSFDYNSLQEACMVKGFETSDGVVELVFGNSAENIENIFIKKFSGGSLIIKNLNENITVNFLKNKIYEIEGIPPNEQCLLYNLKTLEGHRTLSYYKIKNDTTIYLNTYLRGGSNAIHVLDPEFLDPRYNYDFTGKICSRETYMRGNFKYNRPNGWGRIALKVLDQFSDNDWLGVQNRRTPFESVEGEWIVSYHGTAKFNANSIAKDGFLLSKGKRFVFGHGIYSTPNIEIAAKYYAKDFVYDREKYKVVFQNRVKPDAYKTVSTDLYGDYFVIGNDRDIRPYGLCFQKVKMLTVNNFYNILRK